MASLGSYSTSTALSATHYKLVQAVEQARTADDTNAVLLECLAKIKTSWEKKAPSSSKARHDLVLLLYCREQRLLSDEPLSSYAAALFAAEWALPTAVMLAGGGGGGMRERELGYRACADLFPVEPHSLKLLLINTIRSDLHAQPGTSKAEARWALALRAISSPTLVSAELLPAVRERVFELILVPDVPHLIRRLALQALLAFVQADQGAVSASEPTSLAQEARQAVLSLLFPPPPSASSSSSRRTRHRSSPSSDHPLPFLAALSCAISPSSPLHPVLPDRDERVRLHIAILRKLLEAPEEETKRTRYKRVRGGWAMEAVLKGLKQELEGGQGELEAEARDAVAKVVWEMTETLLNAATELSDALILSALRILHLLPSTNSPAEALPRLLTHTHSIIHRPPTSNAYLFALRALALLPPSTWAAPAAPADSALSSASVEAEWGEPAWRTLLSGLDNPDSSIRRATLDLLRRVDASLVELHYRRLLQSLSSNVANRVEGSVSSAASTTSVVGRRKARARVVPRLLETLPYLPSSVSSSSPPGRPSPLPPASALHSLLSAPELALLPTDVLPEVVLPVLDAFQYEENEAARRAFAQGLFDGRDEGGKKRWKGNLTVGLLVAVTVHVLAERESSEMAAQELAEWLAGEDASTHSDFQPLVEPLTFALLRLLSLSPTPTSTYLASLHPSLARAASAQPPETAFLLNLAAQATTADNSTLRAVLAGLGKRTRRKSLAEFSEALLARLDSAPLDHAATTPILPQDSASSTSFSPAPLPPGSSSLRHPYPPTAQPLRYSAYPSSAPPPSSVLSASAATISPTSPFLSLPADPSSASFSPSSASPPRAKVSAAARAREQRDLLREREDRGGRPGAAGRGAESVFLDGGRGGRDGMVMSAGELALRAEGLGLADKDEEAEEEEEGGEDELGKRSRETSGSEADGAGEPPADLLLDFGKGSSPVEALEDPFHSGH
ncbi:hypothetical protein JCM8097_005935 [Rhodosporidiobolus ruineniae]